MTVDLVDRTVDPDQDISLAIPIGIVLGLTLDRHDVDRDNLIIGAHITDTKGVHLRMISLIPKTAKSNKSSIAALSFWVELQNLLISVRK